MKLVFLPQTARSLLWFRRYYEQVFPEGATLAKKQYKTTILALKEHPYIGQAIEGRESRILHIPRTPFSFIYRLNNQRIEILTVYDNRQNPDNL